MFATYSTENVLRTYIYGAVLTISQDPHSKVVSLDSARKKQINIEDIKSEYENNFRNYFGYAYSLAYSKDSATDIIQNVFAKIVAKINRDGFLEIDNLEAYIIRSIRNEQIDRKKKEIRRNHKSSAVEEFSPSAESQHLQSQENQILKEAIGLLPTSQRTCLIMFYFNEMKIEEISNELGISSSAVKTHLQRAKQNLNKKQSLISERHG